MAKTNNQYTFTTDDASLAGSIMALMTGGATAPVTTPTTPAATPAPVATPPVPAAAPAPVSTPPIPAAAPAPVSTPPVPVPVAAPAAPRGEPAPGWTIEHPKGALGALAGAKGPAAVAQVLAQFGVKTLPDLDPAQWHLLYEAATLAAK